MNICCCDWSNKETDWPIAGQVKLGFKKNRLKTGKKSKVWGDTSQLAKEVREARGQVKS